MVTFHLQLLQNICYIPCDVQYILEAILYPIICSSHFPTAILTPFFSPLLTTAAAAAAAAAKSLQSCLTLCHPTDGRPPGSPVPGILWTSTMEWAAISFSNA